MKRHLAGTAIQFTYISCGTTINSGHVSIYSDSETLIASATYTASGVGFYYAIMNVTSVEGMYTARHHPISGTDAFGNDAIWRKDDRFQIILHEGGA